MAMTYGACFGTLRVIRTNLPATASVSGMGYSWSIDCKPGSTTEVTVCVTEMEADVPSPLPPCPAYDVTPTTANIGAARAHARAHTLLPPSRPPAPPLPLCLCIASTVKYYKCDVR